MAVKVKQSSPTGKILAFIVIAFLTLLGVYYFTFTKPSASLASNTSDTAAVPAVIAPEAPPKQGNIRRVAPNPDLFYVNMTVSTTIGIGSVIVEVHRDWAPLGAARFEELVKVSYFDEAKFFRVIKGFMAQFGIHKDPTMTKQWQGRTILDDPVKQSNTRGTLTFATSGRNTRVNQLYFNFGDNHFLDKQGFSPIGKVVKGMEFIDGLYSGYGEGGKGDGSDGKGPGQGRINNQGNKYLEQFFPKLSHIVSATVMEHYEL